MDHEHGVVWAQRDEISDLKVLGQVLNLIDELATTRVDSEHKTHFLNTLRRDEELAVKFLYRLHL